MIHGAGVASDTQNDLSKTANRGSILIVEDDPRMQRILTRVFSSENYSAVVAGDGQVALDMFVRARPHAVVLDLILPEISGRELCQRFKHQSSDTPVVVLSAITDVADKVLLLELGADDYVTKPFSPRELTARVQAAIRRRHKPAVQSTYRFADYEVDFKKMTILRAGVDIKLTAHEFKLLKFFAENPERALTRDVLLNGVWGMNVYPTNRTVDNQMLKLRQKLEYDPANPKHLLTVYGYGYKFVP
ncbi:MAG TPA: response regulator transcription factor [Terracidiphilus sp.]|nr:response regulator transcription factor [Terracidiphilus sp.]